MSKTLLYFFLFWNICRLDQQRLTHGFLNRLLLFIVSVECFLQDELWLVENIFIWMTRVHLSLCTQLWGMRGQIVTGNLSYLLITIELESRTSFVQSMSFLSPKTVVLIMLSLILGYFAMPFFRCSYWGLNSLAVAIVIFRYEEKRWVSRDGRERSPYVGGTKIRLLINQERKRGMGMHMLINL